MKSIMSDQPNETPQPAYTADDLDVENILQGVQYFRRICATLLRLLDGICVHLQEPVQRINVGQPSDRTSTE
jgi:hypothetical protein